MGGKCRDSLASCTSTEQRAKNRLEGARVEFIFQLAGEFCVWFFLTFLQGLFGCLHPVQDPQLVRLQWIGAAVLVSGVLGIPTSFLIGGILGFAWGAIAFAIAVFLVLIAGAIGGRLENAVRDERTRKELE